MPRVVRSIEFVGDELGVAVWAGPSLDEAQPSLGEE